MIRHFAPITCLVALLAVCPLASAAPILAFDINDRSGDATGAPPGPDTAPGFSPFAISAAGGSDTVVVDGYTVNLQAVNAAGDPQGAFDDRDRVVPTTAPTLNQLYDDFIFVGNSAGLGGGVDVAISGPGLAPNTPYFVSLYAFDGIQVGGGSANPVRVANWFDGNNSDALIAVATFTTNVPPVTDDQYKFTGIALTDAAGQLLLKGRRVTEADVSVYLNGLEIRAIPEPSSVMLAVVVGLTLAGWRRCKR